MDDFKEWKISKDIMYFAVEKIMDNCPNSNCHQCRKLKEEPFDFLVIGSYEELIRIYESAKNYE